MMGPNMLVLNVKSLAYNTCAVAQSSNSDAYANYIIVLDMEELKDQFRGGRGPKP